MEKETGSSNREEPFEIDWGEHGRQAATDESEEAEPLGGSVDLPLEPAPAEGSNTPDALNGLLDFYLYGRRGPRAVPDAGADRPMPALLYPYRDVAAIRHDYPVCIVNDADAPVRTLTDIVDGVLERLATGKDAGESRERLTRHVLRLETEMRRVSENGAAMLTTVWEQAAGRLLEAAANEDKRESLRQSLGAARDSLETDGQLLPCSSESSLRVFLSIVASGWRRKCASWHDDLESLYARASNILAADESHSADMSSPEHLRDATGGEDMDFEKMSGILQQSHVTEPLPEGRRNRIHRALDAIARVKPLFDGSVSLLDTSAKLPFDLQPVRNVCKAVRDRHEERMRTMVEFFKAVRIAELEAGNRYREQAHDRFFAKFDATHLTAEELSFCPPVVLVLDGDFFESPDLAGLFGLLGSELPVMVFAAVDDFAAGAPVGSPAALPGWPARLAAMAVALGDIHVSQTPASMPLLLRDAVSAAFNYDGPALVALYNGDGDTQPGLPGYLAAAAALESRMFPAFVYDPGKGATQAERMSVAGNPQDDSVWPSDQFTYTNASGKEQNVELSFTAADFVYNDIRFESHFLLAEPAQWHEKMTPLHRYLELEPAQIEDRIPYIVAVDSAGYVVRIVVTHHVVDMVRRVAAAWRGTQESGGIGNSFAARALDQERQRLAVEKDEGIAAVEKKYSADLERDLGDLTQEIVQRIAAQLLAEGAGAVPVSMPRPARPAAAVEAPAQEAPAEAAPAEVEEDDDVIVTEDPYIDTPLCTSCNECTKINGKLFAYDGNKQAYIADAGAGTFRDLVTAAEKCPVKIIHPGKPRDPSESGIDDLVKRAEPFN